MSIVPSTIPPSSRDDEKRWFRRTVGCTAGLCLGVVTWAVSSYLASKAMLEIHAALSAASAPLDAGFTEQMEKKLAPLKILALTTGGVFFVFSLGFTVCFARWLLAIRHRRAVEAAAFGTSPASD